MCAATGAGITGINEIEIDALDIVPDYGLNAVRAEIVDPNGNGVRLWLDPPLCFETSLRLIAAYMRVRRISGATP